MWLALPSSACHQDVRLPAACYFIISYWMEKWELLKLSKRPIAYGPELASMVTNLMPYAAVSRLMLQNKVTVPEPHLGGSCSHRPQEYKQKP